MYYVIEGLPGSGKSTQFKKLKEHISSLYLNKETLFVREPGGTEIAERIRDVVQVEEFSEEMSPVCEAYLYASARAQLLDTVVCPVLERGGFVFSDRSFISSLAFQGGGRALGISQVLEINMSAIKSCLPTRVIYLDLPADIALTRMLDQTGDKFEKLSLDFFESVSQGYKKALELPLLSGKVDIIDARGSVDVVFDRLLTVVAPALAKAIV